MRDLFWFQGLLGGAKAQYETTYSWELDYTADIAKCTVPLLVIHCEDDQIVPYVAAGPMTHKLLKNGTLKTYKSFPHGMPTTEAATINSDLLAFIKS